jgi:hypothetical protein
MRYIESALPSVKKFKGTFLLKANNSEEQALFLFFVDRLFNVFKSCRKPVGSEDEMKFLLATKNNFYFGEGDCHQAVINRQNNEIAIQLNCISNEHLKIERDLTNSLIENFL